MLDGPDSEWFAFQISPIFSEVRHVYDLPAPYGPADWRRWLELKRSVLHVLNVSTLTPRCHNLKAIVFSADQQTGRGFADACRILQHGPEYGLQLTWRRADDAQHICRRCLLLERLPQLIEQPRVLDGDDGLIGKTLHQFKLMLLKRSNLATIDDHDPDCLALTRQWRIGLRAQGKVE